MFFVPPTRRQLLRLYTSWAYWRQVGPMYRLTMWWLNRGNGETR